jgi:peptide/nickel transport system substrate-binding protein
MNDHHTDLTEILNPRDSSAIEDAIRRGATRRDLLKMLTAAGATLGLAGAMIGSVRQAMAGTPKRGGEVRFAWAQHGPSDTFDPILNTNSIDYARSRLTYNNLCRFNEDLTVRPELVEEFSSNADATEWTFWLRDGVTWHDGSKFTAEDVLYSMSRHIGDGSTSKAKVLFADVKEWIKIDSRTVRAVLNAPNAELPVILATFHFKIVKDGTTDFQKPVGTGPFAVDEFTPGVRSLHSRFEGYWGEEGGPYLDRVEVFGITDAVARVNALISGDVQMAGNIDPKAIPQVEATDGVEMFVVPSGACNDIVVRLDTEPGNNPDFVLAVKHLQRRDRILEVVQKGRGSIGNDHAVGPAYGADWCKEQTIRAYDPDKAKFHLQKSGIARATLDVAEVSSGVTDMCLILQRECAKIGLDLQLNRVPLDGYWSTTWLKAPMHVGSWNMRPSANIMMTIAYKSDAPWNESRWRNERFDDLLRMARAELDPAKRYEMNCEMQRLVSDGAGTLIPTHIAYVDAKVSNLKGLPKVPLSPFGGMEWPEYAWLDV